MADTLGFEPKEQIPWREDMTVSEMLEQITEFQDEYMTARIQEDGKRRTEIRKELLVKYIMNIMEGEDIGVQDESETRHVIEEFDNEENEGSHSSTLEGADNVAGITAEISESCESTSSAPASLEMDSFMDNNGNSDERPIDIKTQETRNLCKAYNHIKGIVEQQKTDNQNAPKENSIGLLDVETCILETHKILMDGLLEPENGSRPGAFSTNRRITGDGFEYPYFPSETLAEAAVQQLVDRHNDTLNKLSRIQDRKERVKYLFKCTSLFLNGFLLLHPFPDGNGRLARLLCGYMLLRSLFPFTLPIYNVYSSSTRDDYIQALRQARKLDRLPETISDKKEAYRAANIAWEQKPELLCSMLIESNWCVWGKYREMLQGKGKSLKLFSLRNEITT